MVIYLSTAEKYPPKTWLACKSIFSGRPIVVPKVHRSENDSIFRVSVLVIIVAVLLLQLILLTPKRKKNQSCGVSPNLQMFTVYSVGCYKNSRLRKVKNHHFLLFFPLWNVIHSVSRFPFSFAASLAHGSHFVFAENQPIEPLELLTET